MVSLLRLSIKKTFRELTKLIGPALTLSCVMAAGLSSLIMSQSNLMSLVRSQQLTYQNLNFADALIPLVRIPRSVVDQLKDVKGIKKSECRLSESGQVRIPKEEKQIAARFHSFPEKHSLNQLRLVEGLWPQPRALLDVILSDAFAKAWNIRVGDRVEVLIRGKSFHLRISALARSPEYIYQTGSATTLPDDKLFSIWWIHPRILEKTSDLQSSCNEILLSLASKDTLSLIEPNLADRLKSFGYTQSIPRRRQLSHYFLDSEMMQLRAMSLYMPGLFLAVTMFLLNITMTRVLITQRESIGTLRAFGFERRVIVLQALGLALCCLLPGLLIAIAFGLWLSKKMFGIYILFYRFAYVSYAIDKNSLFISIGLCLLTATMGCLWGLRNIFRESPAAALIPSAPQHTRVTALDSSPLLRAANLTVRMSLRNLLRRPFQSLVTCVGLILATALLVFARFEQDAINQLLISEYSQTQRQSHTLIFSQRLPFQSEQSLKSQLRRGYSEFSLTLPVTLKHGAAARELTLIVKSDRESLRSVDQIPVKARHVGGLSLSRSLASALNLRPPVRVQLITKDKNPTEVSVDVTNLNENLMGTIATLSIGDFTELFRGEKTFNTMLFKNERDQTLNEKRLFAQFPALVGISEKDFEKRAFEKTMAENIGIFRNFMIGFALLIAMGVLYNNARIQFAEREREFALLRALGFYETEMTLLFWTDFIFLTAIALAPGLWLGRKILEAIMLALETEVFRIPVIISAQSYLWATTVLLIGVLLTALLIQPQIHRIAFLSVLKTRE